MKPLKLFLESKTGPWLIGVEIGQINIANMAQKIDRKPYNKDDF